MSASTTKYVDLGDESQGGGHTASIWWSEKQPDRMTLTINDPRITAADGTKPGLRVVFSANPKSADYSPSNYNRCRRLLKKIGAPHPAEDIPEHPRHLRYRDAVIADVFGDAGASAPAHSVTSSDDDVLANAVECPKCFSLVTDLDGHEEALHS